MRKKKSKKYTKKKKSNKPSYLIYYKMKKCKYCKIFEKELWNKIIHYCKKHNIKTRVIIRENNLKQIPNIIKKYPSFVKCDQKDKMILFKDNRKLNNFKRFLN